MVPCAVRSAAAADLPALTTIYNDFVERTPITFDLEPFSVEERRPWLSQFSSEGRHRLFVAEEQGRVVGYAGSHRFRQKRAYDTTAEVTIYVAQGAHGRGIGRLLYQTLFDALQQEDVQCFVAGITLPNVASVVLHERFGFVPCGVMRGVGRKFGRMWDVAWYQRAPAY